MQNNIDEVFIVWTMWKMDKNTNYGKDNFSG